jgi:hypothetical protein
MDLKLLTESVAKELMESQFSNWKYRLPRDPEQILYDFYFLSFFAGKFETGDKNLNIALKEATEEIAESLRKYMLKAVKYALACELRHVFTQTEDFSFDSSNKLNFRTKEAHKLTLKTKDFLDRFSKKYKSIKKTLKTKADKEEAKKMLKGILKGKDFERSGVSNRVAGYKDVISILKDLKMSDEDFAKIASEIFKDLNWYSSFGGKAWANIADGWLKLYNAESVSDRFLWIDHVYDLQHNSDTVFNKVRAYYKYEHRSDADDETGYSWLGSALDWKKEVEDIREYYDLVSPNLKRVVPFVSKSMFKKTMEDPLKKRHKDYQKTWKGGIWRSGTWEGGTWKDGIWKDGTWEDGIWKDGTWEDGTWKVGTWERGKIWSKKFKKFFLSYDTPKYFKTLEKKARDPYSFEHTLKSRKEKEWYW